VKRIRALDHFRAIAILLVVAGHSYGPWVIDRGREKLLANLMNGGTSLFVFISGFFFHHVYADDFRYATFVRTKAKTVLLPYAVLSSAAIGYHLLANTPLPNADLLGYRMGFEQELTTWADYARLLAAYLWTGQIAAPYWYVPFIFGVFVLSPMFLAYTRLSFVARTSLLIGMLAAAAYIQRPQDNLSLLHSILYFTPMYLCGIVYSMHRARVDLFLHKTTWHFGVVMLGLAALQARFSDHFGNYHKRGLFTPHGVDLLLFQKVAMCAFLIGALNRVGDRPIPGLRLIAASSFAIFFLHPFVLDALKASGFYDATQFLGGATVVFISVPIVVLASLAVASLVRLLLKQHSRYLIGW